MADHEGIDVDIVEFLRARLDEDERDAKEALAYQQEKQGTSYVPHWLRSPTQMLREVEAQRRIVALWERSEFCERVALDDVLDLLALPYAEHPDYQQEWAPENWEESSGYVKGDLPRA